ncbi:mannonate dehydratase [Gammaproteobacteria bacterium]|mgnify:CR=1 FL=1|nr:mannonate dehydratase [Gammaproteobacteria bacterium]MDA8925350.1 mannonate dehydratase [Gammaproteobacteria bacterium]MDA9340374.1 mannonate dehydratase [Gammaproteobacteria bacterium]MDB4210358.1 mannonate dehydratase [Gammaproteobacteria bacterium]MDB9700983.1 mannonate dehydratase [Gammaproteobacteria bacterium]|tara:strand:+ start:94 stop:1305 length:1212 start_codon:yes stop_codon:yes gene_type:complete
MKQSWRWFGPDDPVSIDDIKQTGATDIVSALHHIPIGDVWPIDAIKEHQELIRYTDSGESNLSWTVVESIPIHEHIKLGLPGSDIYINNWITSIENLEKCGIKKICYNFMPVIDWTRTDLKYKLPNGSYSLSFDQNKFAVFDLFILERTNANEDYSDKEISLAKDNFDLMTESEKKELTNNIIAGLPGRMTESYNLNNFKDMLAKYKDISAEKLRNNLFIFLKKVLPTCEKLKVNLAIHPDDPPRDMLGLPRIICTKSDLEILFNSLPSPSNGMTLCVGTYSSRPDNNIPELAKEFASRIHFSHLRSVCINPNEQRSFYEAAHLDGDVDMVEVISELLKEENRRRANGLADSEIHIRPDHGHLMMDDIHKEVNPGYSKIGRMKGLAEIRGVIKALSSRIKKSL